MTVLRLIAIILVFVMVSLAWFLLGGTLKFRTADLANEVSARWGPEGLAQKSPTLRVHGGDNSAGRELPPLSSRIEAWIDHANRYMGLLWFSTYSVRMQGQWEVQAAPGDQEAVFSLPLPSTRTQEDFSISMDGKRIDETQAVVPGQVSIALPNDGQRHTIAVSYSTRALDSWTYVPTQPLLRDFTLTVHTNFHDIDYPKGSISPNAPASSEKDGMQATWRFANIRMDQAMGIQTPSRPNAGPLAARMSFFAPISLLFFGTVLFTVVLLRKLSIHPMHYVFIAAGFFAFHILLAYLVDIVNIHAAFWICAAVSVALVVSYMRLVTGIRFAVVFVGLAQMIFLVGFSYAFFWQGRTGLTITIGAILTLFALMQATGRVDWNTTFSRISPKPPTPPSPVPPSHPSAEE